MLTFIMGCLLILSPTITGEGAETSEKPMCQDVAFTAPCVDPLGSADGVMWHRTDGRTIHVRSCALTDDRRCFTWYATNVVRTPQGNSADLVYVIHWR